MIATSDSCNLSGRPSGLSRVAPSTRYRLAPERRGAADLPSDVGFRSIASNNTRQGYTRKGILKPAGFLFLGSGKFSASGRCARS